MTRVASITVLVLVMLGMSIGVLAVADHRSAEKIADGTRVGGVDVGGLTREQALQRVSGRVGPEIGRPARVRIGQRTFMLSAADAGVHVDLKTAVRRAYDSGRAGNLVTRRWRALTGASSAHNEPAAVGIDRRAIRSFVGQIQRSVSDAPVDAGLTLAVDRVTVTPSRIGRRLSGSDELAASLISAMSRRRGTRSMRAHTAPVAPTITAAKLLASQPVAVTISRKDRRVRVFRGASLVQSYRVAVGEPKYPTPTGRFVVQTMQRNPSWNVPQSAWAGDLAGQTIPGGDPRNPLVARWIGFNGSVGFHGTKSVDSLGRAASHGCVRMNAADVSDLFDRVRNGTPVLVA